MRRKDYHIGPGAVSLLLVVVIVSMSVLGLLALISARSNYKLTDRAAEFAVAEHTAAVNAQISLAQLDAVLADCAAKALDDARYMSLVADSLPEGMMLDGRTVCWTEMHENSRMLQCAVDVLPLGSAARYEWAMHAFAVEE